MTFIEFLLFGTCPERINLFHCGSWVEKGGACLFFLHELDVHELCSKLDFQVFFVICSPLLYFVPHPWDWSVDSSLALEDYASPLPVIIAYIGLEDQFI